MKQTKPNCRSGAIARIHPFARLQASVCALLLAAGTGFGVMFRDTVGLAVSLTHLEKLMQAFLRKSFIVSGLVLASAIIGQNANADPGDTVHWKSIIGIIQANSVVGTGTGAVTGAPGPWSSLGGSVSVNLDRGKLDFDVRGLVLAAGNSIGTPGSTVQVKGTLVCDTNGSAGANSVLVDTPFVDLDDEGDARFHGNVGALPAVCTTEADIAFLIRTSSGRWIANGTVIR